MLYNDRPRPRGSYGAGGWTQVGDGWTRRDGWRIEVPRSDPACTAVAINQYGEEFGYGAPGDGDIHEGLDDLMAYIDNSFPLAGREP